MGSQIHAMQPCIRQNVGKYLEPKRRHIFVLRVRRSKTEERKSAKDFLLKRNFTLHNSFRTPCTIRTQQREIGTAFICQTVLRRLHFPFLTFQEH